jgi:hypothetical protein
MKLFVRAAVLIAAVTLGACAAGARPEQIAAAAAPTSFDANHQLRSAVTMEHVQGGSETNPLWMSNISDEQFQAGLEASLRNAGLLASSPDLARYRLSASLQELNRPLAGFDMSVTMSVRYTLTPVDGGAPVYDEVVRATGVGRMSDAFVGVERLRIANEAAARENITEFLRRLEARVPAQSITPVS